MATFNKFQPFVENLSEAVANLSLDDKYVALTNTAPTAGMAVFSELTEISAGTGYTAGGTKATLSSSGQSSGTYKLVLADPTKWTGSGAGMGPFRYAVLYQNSGTKPLIGYWDYGSSITLNVGEEFTVDFDATNGVLQLT